MIEAGRMDLDVSDVNLESLIDDSVEVVVSKAAYTQVALRFTELHCGRVAPRPI